MGLSCQNFPLNSIISVCLCLFSYSLKVCWNIHFWASRGTKILKFSGALPLDPFGAYCAPQTPQLFAPSLRSIIASLRSGVHTNSKGRSRCLQVAVQGSKKSYPALPTAGGNNWTSVLHCTEACRWLWKYHPQWVFILIERPRWKWFTC